MEHSRRLAEHVAGLQFDSIPDEIVELARIGARDWLGVALSGSGEPVVDLLVRSSRQSGCQPVATAIGRGDPLSSLQAALVNGAASNAHDFDDVMLVPNAGHPSAPMLAALFAVAEQLGADGRTFITAYVAGMDVAHRLALAVNPGHTNRGYLGTGTICCIASSAAVARLLGLDTDQTLSAISLAATQAAGLTHVFGTMANAFQAGKSAQNALLSAQLAQDGLTSSPGILEEPRGFGAVLGEGVDAERLSADLGREFGFASVMFKRFPT
ncbi:MAG: MmgE/PrpD family protein [Chloroflexi bacterium]|nr:MmgE/PrpD family protein [Chloroflexota bacterium]